jgi:UDP:flavonoid glycosyltransferase YjiC (YdhE family)
MRPLGFAPDRLSGEVVQSSSRRGRIMLCSSNGGGLGHLTRLMAIARRLPAAIDAVFVTMSVGLPLVAREGYIAEYIPPAATLRADNQAWHRYLRQRMDKLIDRYEPDVLVFDGVLPYRGLLDSWRGQERCKVWLRRAMWRSATLSPSSPGETAHAFDLVIEPGEIAVANDVGATTVDRRGVRRVPPIVHLDESELVSREAARDALGLDRSRPAAFLSLGAGNINDVGVTIRRIVDKLRATGDVQPVVMRSPITAHGSRSEGHGAVLVRSVYPVSRYLRAFDVAFSAAGYNSFHELIAFAVPTVFVPNEYAIVDDQGARARFAEWAGAALTASEWSADELVRRVDAVLDPHLQAHLTARCRQVFPGNGAAAAATLLADLATARTSGRGF